MNQKKCKKNIQARFFLFMQSKKKQFKKNNMQISQLKKKQNNIFDYVAT